MFHLAMLEIVGGFHPTMLPSKDDRSALKFHWESTIENNSETIQGKDNILVLNHSIDLAKYRFLRKCSIAPF
jgi:hypothetical protein